MVTTATTITTTSLQEWLQEGKNMSVLDVRPPAERAEWYIPGSIHVNAYEKLKANEADALGDVHLDKEVPVVVVCAAGNTSQKAAALLSQQGYKAFSLEGGMKAWSLAWNTATLNFKEYQIVQVRRTGKGCLSYIVVSGQEALVVDASLPIEVYKNLLQENNWTLKAVVETHIHADHLSRSKQLANAWAVPLMLPIPNKVRFPYQGLEPGREIVLGSVTLKVLPTPGHTIESVCFLVGNEVLLSGDTLFTNAVGRPDLKANEQEAKTRTELLYDSLQKLMELDDHLMVLPAHTNTPVAFDGSPIKATIAEIKSNVAVLRLSKTEFVKTILDKLPPAPPNHLTIVERNLSGEMADINPTDLEAGANRCAVS